MLADLAAWISTHYLSLLFGMLSVASLALACMCAIFIWRRRDLVLGVEDVPTYVPPPPTRILLPAHSHAAREDADTRPLLWGRTRDGPTLVIPSIPGATRELSEFVDAVEDVTAVLRVIEHDEPVTDALLERVRNGLKDGSDKGSDATQVIDLCPLTTLEFEIVESAPLFRETFTRYPHTELTTQNLTAALERAKESVA
jgi:hypothetical protein